MFEVGEYIVYGSNGVCRVENIGPMELAGVSRDRLYYTLIPNGQKDGKIYTPVDNEKVVMRRVLSEEEARALIDEIKDMDTIWVSDEKRRENIYKEVIHQCDSREWVKIIKTLYLRKRSRIAEGKKVTAVDERYLKIAEENLYGELAVALRMEKDGMADYIKSYIARQEE